MAIAIPMHALLLLVVSIAGVQASFCLDGLVVVGPGSHGRDQGQVERQVAAEQRVFDARGLSLRPGYRYVVLPLPAIPTLPEWRALAALAGVDLDDPQIAGSLEHSLAAFRKSERERRQAIFAADIGRMEAATDSTRAPTLGRREEAEVVVRGLAEAPGAIEREAASLRTALYAAQAEGASSKLLEDARVARVVALATRRVYRYLVLLSAPVRVPAFLAEDLEDSRVFAEPANWNAGEVQDSLSDYERVAQSRLGDLLRAEKAYWSSVASGAEEGALKGSMRRTIELSLRLWEFEVRAADQLVLADPGATRDARTIRRSRMLQPAAPFFVSLSRLEAISPRSPLTADLRISLLRKIREATESMQAAYMARQRELMESGFSPDDQADENERYESKMRSARATFAADLSVLLGGAEGSLRKDADAGARSEFDLILAAMRPMGSAEEGVWKFDTLQADWPGKFGQVDATMPMRASSEPLKPQ